VCVELLSIFYLVVKYIWDNLKPLGYSEKFIFNTLEKIQYTTYTIHKQRVNLLPDILLPHQKLILDKLKVRLTHQLL
jgi:hypothetical protein